MKTKFIFITGGVLSSLGKGLSAASIGALLKTRGLTVTIQKLDPYINVDPGTMNPYQHGEVYVTDDGAETDLDLGHYERYLNTVSYTHLDVYKRQPLLRASAQAEPSRGQGATCANTFPRWGCSLSSLRNRPSFRAIPQGRTLFKALAPVSFPRCWIAPC